MKKNKNLNNEIKPTSQNNIAVDNSGSFSNQMENIYRKEVGQRLRKIAKEQFGSSKKLAELLNMKPQTFQLYVAGKALPGGFIIKKLLELNVDVNYLLNGVNFTDELRNRIMSEINIKEKKYGYEYPLVNSISAGPMLEFYINEDTVRIPFDYHKKESCFALEVKGDSMSPTIENGDYVLVDTSLPLFNNCIVAVRFKDGGQIIKRYTKISDNMIQLDSDNLEYKSIITKIEDIELLFPVVRIQRDIYSKNKIRIKNGF